MSTKLLPCPCCNGKAETSEGGFGPIDAAPMFNLHFVGCTDCGLLIAAKTMEAAIAAWNRRFVGLDRNGETITTVDTFYHEMGDGSEFECRAEYHDYQWWAVEVQHTFDVRMSFKLSECREIELIKEDT